VGGTFWVVNRQIGLDRTVGWLRMNRRFATLSSDAADAVDGGNADGLESRGMVVVKGARSARVRDRDRRRRGKCGAHSIVTVSMVVFTACSVGVRAQCTTANSVGALRNASIPSTGPAPCDKYVNGLQSNSANSATSVASVPATISSALRAIHEVDAAKGTGVSHRLWRRVRFSSRVIRVKEPRSFVLRPSSFVLRSRVIHRNRSHTTSCRRACRRPANRHIKSICANSTN